jgi:hypothetical protein
VELDSQKMRVLFAAIRPLITSGFGEPQMAQIERDFAALAVNDTKEITFPIVVYGGTSSDLSIRIRKEDVDTVEIHFFGAPELVEKLQQTIRATPLDVN